MPTHSDTLCEYVKCRKLPALQQWRLRLSTQKLMLMESNLLVLMARAKQRGRMNEVRKYHATLLLMASSVVLNMALMSLPRQQSTTEGEVRNVDYFSEMEFY